MYHTGLRYAALAATIALGASACAVPHNNVLVFGTDTNFGVGVDIAPDPSSPVGVNIGYKRKEAVWMPLVVNEQDCGYDSVPGSDNTNPKCKTKTALSGDDPAKVLLDSKFVGSAKGISPEKGGSGEELDTYSVFASFGGNAKGGKDGGAVAVAQFFATGIAAQRLGANPGATRLVSAATGDAAMVQGAEERAEAAENRLKELQGFTGASDEDAAAAAAMQTSVETKQNAVLDLFFGKNEQFSSGEKAAWLEVQEAEAVKALSDAQRNSLAEVKTKSDLKLILAKDDTDVVRNALVKTVFGME